MSTVYTFYAGDGISFLNLRFENDVKMYGIQAPFPSGGKLSRSHVGLFSQVIVPVSCDPGR